jgi:hypothetical protein
MEEKMRKIILLVLALSLLAGGCATYAEQLPEEKYPTSREFDEPFEVVWDAVLDIARKNWPLRTVDKLSGFIGTDWIRGSSDYIFKTGLLSSEKDFALVQFTFNISVKEKAKEKGTLVDVDLFEDAEFVENYGSADNPDYSIEWRRVKSSTKREYILLMVIEKKLAGLTGKKDVERERIFKRLGGLLREEKVKKAKEFLALEISFLEKESPLRKALVKKLKELEGNPEKEK